MSRPSWFRPFITASLALATFFAVGPQNSRAARDQAAPAAGPRFELLVMEIRNCGVCEVIREVVQPHYAASQRAQRAPMRFVDITSINEMDLGLRNQVRTLPTVILMQDGREIDRLTGFMDKELYFETLNAMVDAVK